MAVQNSCFRFIWTLCFIGTVLTASSQDVLNSITIDNSARVGKGVKIGANVTIKAHAKIGKYAQLGSNTLIEENATVEKYAIIRASCIIGHDGIIQKYVGIANNNFIKSEVKIQKNTKLIENNVIGNRSSIARFVKIGNSNRIGTDVKIHEYVIIGDSNLIRSGSIIQKKMKIGNNITIGNRVDLNEHATIKDNAEIGDGSILAKYSTIGKQAKLQSKVYIGKSSSIGKIVTVGASAVIHRDVEIPKNAIVQPNEVVIPTPSSLYFYENCASDVSKEDAEIASRPANGTISPEFNSFLRQRIDEQLSTLNTVCDQSIKKRKPKHLPDIMSFYLIQYHGLNRFKKYVRKVQSSGNCFSSDSVRKQLRNELHFGENAERNILEIDVQEKFVQLLAIDRDADRDERVENDTYCIMIEQIRSKKRGLTCVDPIKGA